jgi:hypothetical protein
VKTLGLTWAGSDAVAKAGKLESAMPKQPHLDTIVAGDHISQDQLHDSGYSSVDGRMVLTGAAAATTELMSMPASALEPPTADLAAALARLRSSVPPNFNRDYVEHVVIPFFLTSLYQGERPVMPMINVNFSKSRNVRLSNSGFGTVFGVVDGKPQPVCDYAGFAPFGFGYRRWPRRATDDQCVRGFSTQGLARQDRFPQAQSGQSWPGPDRAEHSDRGRYWLCQTGMSTRWRCTGSQWRLLA